MDTEQLVRSKCMFDQILDICDKPTLPDSACQGVFLQVNNKQSAKRYINFFHKEGTPIKNVMSKFELTLSK